MRIKAIFAAGLIAVAAAFLLCGYEAIRSTSNTLFKATYGKKNLPVVMALTPLAVLGMLYGYGRMLSSVGPRKTLLFTSLMSSVAIGGCYLALKCGWSPVAGFLYVVREAYVVLLIEQYWSFLNSTFTSKEAKILNGPICGIGSLGAIVGGELLYQYSTEWGTVQMILLGVGMLVPATLFSDIAYRFCGEPAKTSLPSVELPVRVDSVGVSLFRSNKRLILLFLVVIATQIISTSTELAFQSQLYDAIPDLDEQNKWSGRFYSQLNLMAALGQFALAPLLLWLLPLGLIHLCIPLLNLGACVYLLQMPSLSSAGFAYMTFKVCDYSVFRAAKEILYIPLSFDVRFRAKQVIDVFGYRLSKGGASFCIFAAQRSHVILGESAYALLGVGAACGWLLLVIPLMGLTGLTDVMGVKSAKGSTDDSK
jgi:hypothetical protein